MWTSDDELDAEQLAAMDAVWRARRQAGITGEEANETEALVRNGHVAAARKRLTAARRRAREQREPAP